MTLVHVGPLKPSQFVAAAKAVDSCFKLVAWVHRGRGTLQMIAWDLHSASENMELRDFIDLDRRFSRQPENRVQSDGVGHVPEIGTLSWTGLLEAKPGNNVGRRALPKDRGAQARREATTGKGRARLLYTVERIRSVGLGGGRQEDEALGS